MALAGLPQGTAEEYYIIAAQQLEGYGQQIFLAKVFNILILIVIIYYFLFLILIKLIKLLFRMKMALKYHLQSVSKVWKFKTKTKICYFTGKYSV